jgi:hypothetical protein
VIARSLASSLSVAALLLCSSAPLAAPSPPRHDGHVDLSPAAPRTDGAAPTWVDRQWGGVLAASRHLASTANALIAAADHDLRTVRDAAADYLHKHAEAAPRLRGVHLYVELPADTVLDSPEPPPHETDLAWRPLEPDRAPARIVLLIHGLDEPGRVWDDLAPILHAHGHHIARFDYPNDQAIAASADLLATSLRELRAAGTREVELVCHSMGGLVSRDVLTRPEHYRSQARGHDDLPDITRLILLGTPNHGSPWAHLQCLSDAAEQVDRWAHGDQWDPRPLLGFLADGRGEAARDLLPGSDFLTDLNARPMPVGIAITAVVAIIDPGAGETPIAADDAADVLSPGRIARLRRSLGGRLGDGVVSAASAQLDGAETVIVAASHRGMVRASRLEGAIRRVLGSRQDRPPAIGIILERLSPVPPAEP